MWVCAQAPQISYNIQGNTIPQQVVFITFIIAINQVFNQVFLHVNFITYMIIWYSNGRFLSIKRLRNLWQFASAKSILFTFMLKLLLFLKFNSSNLTSLTFMYIKITKMMRIKLILDLIYFSFIIILLHFIVASNLDEKKY